MRFHRLMVDLRGGARPSRSQQSVSLPTCFLLSGKVPVRASKMLALPFAESLTSRMLVDSDNCEQITQRILLSIEFENLQAGC
jgi:hypothetical protein